MDDLTWGAIWFDADNNGWLDLFIGSGTSLYTDYPSVLDLYPDNANGFFLNNGGAFPLEPAFANVLTDNELTFSSAYADHNQDGAMDFVSHRMGPHARLLNGIPNGNHWLQIRVISPESNRDAIGAVVTSWKGGVPDMRTVTCGSEYLNQNGRWLHFGLGTATTIDSVAIDWPDGAHSVMISPEIDTRHLVNQAAIDEVVGECTYPMACNFNPEATVDDGSCDMSCACGPGTLWDDLNQVCVAACQADQDGDGLVTTSDLILFLTMFGASCE